MAERVADLFVCERPCYRGQIAEAAERMRSKRALQASTRTLQPSTQRASDSISSSSSSHQPDRPSSSRSASDDPDLKCLHCGNHPFIAPSTPPSQPLSSMEIVETLVLDNPEDDLVLNTQTPQPPLPPTPPYRTRLLPEYDATDSPYVQPPSSSSSTRHSPPQTRSISSVIGNGPAQLKRKPSDKNVPHLNMWLESHRSKLPPHQQPDAVFPASLFSTNSHPARLVASTPSSSSFASYSRVVTPSKAEMVSGQYQPSLVGNFNLHVLSMFIPPMFYPPCDKCTGPTMFLRIEPTRIVFQCVGGGRKSEWAGACFEGGPNRKKAVRLRRVYFPLVSLDDTRIHFSATTFSPVPAAHVVYHRQQQKFIWVGPASAVNLGKSVPQCLGDIVSFTPQQLLEVLFRETMPGLTRYVCVRIFDFAMIAIVAFFNFFFFVSILAARSTSIASAC